MRKSAFVFTASQKQSLAHIIRDKPAFVPTAGQKRSLVNNVG